MKIHRLAFVAAMTALPGQLHAQQQSNTVAAPTATPAVATTVAEIATPCCTVPSGTIVEISIDAALNSKTAKIGDHFDIHLTTPVQLTDGHVMLAAGTKGVGEVIHASKARIGGKAGELLLVARYLDVNGTQVPLRGFRFGGQGKDNGNLVFAATVAIGVAGYFISGGEKRVAQGTIATAKIAVDTKLPPLPITTVVTNGPAPITASPITASTPTQPPVNQRENQK
jgi:hypothetical protein